MRLLSSLGLVFGIFALCILSFFGLILGMFIGPIFVPMQILKGRGVPKGNIKSLLTGPNDDHI